MTPWEYFPVILNSGHIWLDVCSFWILLFPIPNGIKESGLDPLPKLKWHVLKKNIVFTVTNNLKSFLILTVIYSIDNLKLTHHYKKEIFWNWINLQTQNDSNICFHTIPYKTSSNFRKETDFTYIMHLY